MPQDLTPDQQLKALQAQLSHTTAQVALLSQQHQLLLAQAKLHKAESAAPWATLQGLKAGLASLAVPGEEGAPAASKGLDGTMLLRVKAELLQALNQAAQEILAALPAVGKGYVLASDADVLAACKSEVWVQRFARQQRSLHSALNAALQANSGAAAAGQHMQATSMGAALVASQTVPAVLNAMSDAAKFFCTDRMVSLFDASEEEPRLLEHLLEHHAQQAAQSGSPPVQRIASVTPELVRQAELLLLTLDALSVLHDRGLERLGALQRAAEASLHQPGRQPAAPLTAPELVAKLREEVTAAKAMLDAMDPGLAPEQFWAQVSGQLRQKYLEGMGRLEVRVKAQTVQVLEKRMWAADRLLDSGEVQVEYRITAQDGKLLGSNLMLYASGTRKACEQGPRLRWCIPAQVPAPARAALSGP
jgi:hypothetical protein